MKIRTPLYALACIPALSQGLGPPAWIRALPQQSGRIYAVGTATVAPSESKALEHAAQNARFEVVARLRVNVQGATTITATMAVQKQSGGTAVGSSQQVVREGTSTSVQVANLPGLVIEERYVDRKMGAAYALAYLDVGAAEAGLGSQIEALQEEWKVLKGLEASNELRLSIRRLMRLRALLAQSEALENQAALLIPAGVNASIRSRIQALRHGMDQEAASIQKGLIMGVRFEGGTLGRDILAVLRTAAINQGFTWNQQQARLFLVVNLRGVKEGWDIRRKAWWEVDASGPDFVVARAAIRVSLGDAQGNEYDAFDLNVKGVGTSAFNAEQAILKEVRKGLPDRLQVFLSGLGL